MQYDCEYEDLRWSSRREGVTANDLRGCFNPIDTYWMRHWSAQYLRRAIESEGTVSHGYHLVCYLLAQETLKQRGQLYGTVGGPAVADWVQCGSN